MCKQGPSLAARQRMENICLQAAQSKWAAFTGALLGPLAFGRQVLEGHPSNVHTGAPFSVLQGLDARI